jgi:tetratricopeptide (TPR) repeat protein
LRANVFAKLPVLALLDNFEDNLELRGGAAFTDPRLGELLAAWLERPGRSRLLITCRYPLALPNLADHHLGPLSLAETRKLIWRLAGLDGLSAAERRRAWADVGGHPRALEYLDALVRGGAARFPDVAARMERALERQGIADPRAWLAERGGGFDAALAEAVSLAAGDVLLERLLQGFADVPLAWPLLLGASVYRVPVPAAAPAWQVGEVPALPEEGAKGFPEVAAPAGWAAAWQGLLAAGLAAPYAVAGGGEARFAVHRWTAGKLAAVAGPEELAEAHRRAALFWRWRVALWPQDRGQDMVDLLEARHHHRAAGELDEAVRVTEWVCLQFQTWGAYRRQEQLMEETLRWLPEGSSKAAAFQHQLGRVAHLRGSYDEALDWYRKSLAIEEELGNRAGMATTISQLGVLATERGAPEEAVPLNLRGLDIHLEIGSPEARIDLHWLGRQRELLGASRFAGLLAQHLDEESAAAVLSMLDQPPPPADRAPESG